MCERDFRAWRTSATVAGGVLEWSAPGGIDTARLGRAVLRAAQRRRREAERSACANKGGVRLQSEPQGADERVPRAAPLADASPLRSDGAGSAGGRA